MAAKSKPFSTTQSREFLRRGFVRDQSVLSAELGRARFSISHPGRIGEVSERAVIDTLRRYLPQRYTVDSAVIIDSNGKTSHAIDVVVFDRHFTPTLLDQKGFVYVPAEAVYAVFEVKQALNGSTIKYASEKAASVRNMTVTSVPYNSNGHVVPKKAPINIIAGIIGLEATAKLQTVQGVASSLKPFVDKAELNCGLAMNGCAFDTFSSDGGVMLSNKETALMHFLFRLLGRLQQVGTVPAVDWEKYAEVLSER